MYVLGIETSCDETSCGVVRGRHLCSLVTRSSLPAHRQFGGVVPEIATRAHVRVIDRVCAAAIEDWGGSLNQLSAIAATVRPGLIGSLVVGVNFAKALALALRKPFIGVNHLHAHLFAPFINAPEPPEFPFLGIVVSGGHTDIYRVDDFDRIQLLGGTVDDACGEVYDKVARTFGLGYPGGPVIDRLFDPAEKNAFQFKCGRSGLEVSFSGIKTALVYAHREYADRGGLDQKTVVRLMSSFQESLVSTLVEVLREAVRRSGLSTVVCGGGVTANRYLRTRLKECASEFKAVLPPMEYTADNAAGVAGLGFYLYNEKNYVSPLSLEAESRG
ncbi:MAG: tRNA (adenosine(37)-N6)-threonylcarbamoyltransferase complex transferase subunit TsaD [Candidatus Omnitrophica bacterium]|nr:tRNA (adenosine(37)-N6)-threonylcarbamoyltransferase complex transferase subunit TsaD [Candidatus Omnitrophota bacterium]